MIFSIIEQSLIALPLLFGAYITLSLLKLPDFSIESAYLFGGVMAYLAKDHPLPLVILSAATGGVMVGVIVSFLNQYLRIPYLLAAIVTNGLVHGLTLLFLNGSVNGFRLATPVNEIVLLINVAGVVSIILFVLLRSQMGYCLAIYGKSSVF